MKRATVLSISAAAVIAASAAVLGTRSRPPAAHTKTVAQPAPAVDVKSPPPGVAAVVNGQTIPTSKIADVVLHLQGPSILDQLIGDMLIDQEAKRRHLTATPDEIEARINTIRAMMAPKSLDDMLRARHMNMIDFREDMQSGIEVRKLLANRLAPVKMAHIEDIFVNISPFAGTSPNLHTSAQADRIMETVTRKLKQGVPFKDLARQYGDGDIEGNTGGDLGIVTDFPNADQNSIARGFSGQPAFLKACLTLKAGEIAAPLRTRFGLHLIRALSTAADPLPSDSALYASAQNQAIEYQLTRLAPEYVDSLRRAGKVTVYLNAAKPGPAGIAATVNGQDIPLSHIEDIALHSAGPQVAEKMIDDLLVEQEAEKRHVTATPAQIDAAIDEVEREAAPRKIDDLLRQGHMSMAEFRDTQRAKIEAQSLVAQGIGQIRAAHIRAIGIIVKRDPSVKVGHSEAEANSIMAKILSRLKSGQKFDALAREFSEDPISRAKGGDLGIVTAKDYYEPGFLKAALSLKKGQVTSEPVKTSFEIYLLQAVSTSSDHPASEDRLYSQAEQIAKDREIQKQIPDFIRGLRNHGHVIDYLAIS